MTLPRSLIVPILVLFGACATAPQPSVAALDAPVIFLVRHAETEGGGSDPELSAAGVARAETLAQILDDEGIVRILATPYRRTRATAAPIGARLGIEPELYDPRSLPYLAATLEERGETVLVVGHSNTTPELARLLGGDPGSPIAEDEHDRIYRIELPSARTTIIRYGETY